MPVPDDNAPLRVGDVLYGFCEGYFGRDSYADKIVEAIGSDWVVVRYDDDTWSNHRSLSFYQGSPEFLRKFRVKPSDEYDLR